MELAKPERKPCKQARCQSCGTSPASRLCLGGKTRIASDVLVGGGGQWLQKVPAVAMAHLAAHRSHHPGVLISIFARQMWLA